MSRPLPLIVVVLLALCGETAMAQDPTCPDGWETSASEFTHMPRWPGDFAPYPRKELSVLVPKGVQLMRIHPSSQHPKFCWKDTNTPWECHYTDPWEGAHFRFDTWRAALPSGHPKYLKYSIIAQNETQDEERTAQLLLCYKDRTKEAIAAEAERQRKKLNKLELGLAPATQTICCSGDIPSGWIKVNDQWVPTTCGYPSTIVYNVCLIEKYSDRPVGAEMNVCASAPTPNGWVTVAEFWGPTRCGFPATIVNNVKRIRRLE